MASHTYCPAAIVAAPVETVWDLLTVPESRDEWWHAHTARVVPEGSASPGQVLHLQVTRLGITANRTIRVAAVNSQKHQIQFTVALPLGAVNHQTTTVTAIDAASCRVQFG